MRKLVILIEPPADEEVFGETWPQFLRLSEQMPGLRREASSAVDEVLYGNCRPVLIHELFFDSLEAIQEAMSSPEGRAAGERLQRMTGGRMTLLIADHKEDELENIRRHMEQSARDDDSFAQS
jgi:uncharacterized protein (TIGR02118 family)